MPTPATVVFVHGAWHGPWCWERVLPLLDARGVPHAVVDRGIGSPRMVSSDPHVDQQRVREVVRGIDGPVVLLGHSQGGIGITHAGLEPNVRHLVYLTALVPGVPLPPVGVLRSRALIEGATETPQWRVFDAAKAPAVFYGDCSHEDVAWTLARLDPQQLARDVAEAPAPPELAWRDRPATYVVCTKDCALLPDGQRLLAAHMTEVVEWPTSHSPFVSRPDLVAELVCDLAERYAE